MGEYIKDRKIGTCENLYYTTYEQLKKSGWSEADDYLGLDKGWRYRFPFPDENFFIGNYENFDRGHVIKVPKEVEVELPHEHISTRFGYKHQKDRLSKIGIRFNCPLSLAPQKEDSDIKFFMNNNALKHIEIVQQKYTSGQGKPMLVTVARCPYCRSLAQLSEDEVKAMLEWINSRCINEQNKDYYKFDIEVLEIALAGYKTKDDE